MTLDEIQAHLAKRRPNRVDLPKILAAYERDAMIVALEASRTWTRDIASRSQAAHKLGMSRSLFYRRLRAYGLEDYGRH